MNTERTQAYGRVVKTLEELGPAKLQPAEQERVREAADTLIFAADLDEARTVMDDVDTLAEHLVASDRWSEERARQLVDDLLACGPVTAVG
jgi:polyhydroxyalkanoate synthesis regulator phasin